MERAKGLKGSETEKNLLKAFSVEAQMRNKYDLCRMIAEKDGYDYIAKYFQDATNNRKEHAKLWYKWLHNGEFPNTLYVLKQITSERYTSLINQYEAYAETAQKEGYNHIADLFKHICLVERENIERFKKLICRLQDDHIVPDKDGNYKWECSVCGANFIQKDMPDYCPLCLNEEIFFFKRPFDN